MTKITIFLILLYATSIFATTLKDHENAEKLNEVITEDSNNSLVEKEHDKRTIFSPEFWARHVGYKPSGHRYILGYSPVGYRYTPYIKPLKLRPVKMQFNNWKPISNKPHFKQVVPVVRPISFRPSAPDHSWQPLPANVPPVGGVLKPWQQQGWEYGTPLEKPIEVKPVVTETVVPVPAKPVVPVVPVPKPIVPIVPVTKPVNAVVPIVPIKPAVTHLHPVPIKPVYTTVVFPNVKYPIQPFHLQPVPQPFTPHNVVPQPIVPPHILPQPVPQPQPVFPHNLLPHNIIPHNVPNNVVPIGLPPPHFNNLAPVLPPNIHGNVIPVPPPNFLNHPLPPSAPGGFLPQPFLPHNHITPNGIIPDVPQPAPPSPLVPNPIAPHAGVLPHPHGGTVEFHGKTAHLIPFRGVVPPQIIPGPPQVVPAVQNVLPQPSFVKGVFPNTNFVYPGPPIVPGNHVVPETTPPFTVFPEGSNTPFNIPGTFSKTPGVSVVFPENQHPHVVPTNQHPHVIPNNPNPSFLVPNHQNPNFLVPNNPNPNFLVPNNQNPEFLVPNNQNPNFLVPNNQFDEHFHPHIHTSSPGVVPGGIPGENNNLEHPFNQNIIQTTHGNILNQHTHANFIQPGQTDIQLPIHLPQHPNFRNFQTQHQVNFENTFENNMQEAYLNNAHQYPFSDQLTDAQNVHNIFSKREDKHEDKKNDLPSDFKPSPELHTQVEEK